MLFPKYGKVLGMVLGSLIANLPLPVQCHTRILQQAIQAFDKKEFAQAQQLIDQAIQDGQARASTWYYRGTIYEQLLRDNIASDTASWYLEQALQAYQETLKLARNPSQYHSFSQVNIHGLWTYYLGRGVKYYKGEAFDRAIVHFAVCKQIKPKDSQALLYTAIAAHQDEDYVLALQQYEEYLQQGKHHPAVYLALAHITTHHLQDLEKAGYMLKQGIQQYPWNNHLLQAQRQLLVRLNELAIQEEQLQEQLLTTSSNPVLHYQLGYWYEQENRLEEACRHYIKASKLAPHQIEVISQLGIIHYNQAAQIINSTAEMPQEIFQDQAEALAIKWNFHLQQALAYFEQAYKMKRHDVSLLKQLYHLYTYLAMPTKARKIVRHIRRLKGQNAILDLETTT